MSAGGDAPTQVHMQTDHSYSDHHIALQETVAAWLALIAVVTETSHVGETWPTPMNSPALRNISTRPSLRVISNSA